MTALAYANYWVYVLLFVSGLYLMMSMRNLVKKLVGMAMVQAGVLLFFLTLASKRGATLPILPPGAAEAAAPLYANPLPHALMLTAIVVGVSTLGVALALAIVIHDRYGTLEEDVLLERL